MKRLLFLIIAILSIVAVLIGRQYAVHVKTCGVERWSVKTLMDKDTSEINFQDTVLSSIMAQTSLIPPKKISKDLPRQDDESVLVSVDCYIMKYKKEDDDKDIHIVISDLNLNKTMIAEIPDADACPEIKVSGHNINMKNVRKWFLENVGTPTDRFQECSPFIKVRLTGIGFFDFNHGQTGRAGNGREIHPVLKIESLK